MSARGPHLYGVCGGTPGELFVDPIGMHYSSDVTPLPCWYTVDARYAPCPLFGAAAHALVVGIQEARRCLDRLLKISPNCRQAISLRDVVDDKIAKGAFLFSLLLALSLYGVFLFFPVVPLGDVLSPYQAGG